MGDNCGGSSRAITSWGCQWNFGFAFLLLDLILFMHTFFQGRRKGLVFWSLIETYHIIYDICSKNVWYLLPRYCSLTAIWISLLTSTLPSMSTCPERIRWCWHPCRPWNRYFSWLYSLDSRTIGKSNIYDTYYYLVLSFWALFANRNESIYACKRASWGNLLHIIYIIFTNK